MEGNGKEMGKEIDWVNNYFLILEDMEIFFSLTILSPFITQLITILITVCLCVCVLRLRKHQRRIEHLQSVAYTPLDSYPANTISNNQFIPGDTDVDDELLKDDGEITIQ